MRLLSSAAAASLLVLAVRLAAPDVVLDLGNGDAVRGSFVAAGETESFRFLVPAGARLSVSAKGTRQRKKAAPRAHLTILDGTGADVTTGTGSVVPSGAGEKVVNLTVATSGVHTARVTGDATGDYAFRVQWKPARKTPKSRVEFAAADDEQTVRLAADAGATATFTAASAHAGTHPHVVRVEAADGSWASPDFAAPLQTGATLHVVRNVTLGGTGGDYVLTVRQGGAGAGAADVSAVLRPPKVRPRKADATTRQTGSAVRDNYGVGAPVGPDGGRVAPPDDGLAPIAGASVDVAAGAFAKPVLLVLSSADAVAAPSGSACGPAVAAGLPTLTFRPGSGPTRVTLPFDPEPFGGDFDALDVYLRDARGGVQRVEPKSDYDIDGVRGTVTFPVQRGGAFQAFGPPATRPSDLDGDGFDDLVVPAPDAAGGLGRVLVYRGRADFLENPPAAPDFVLTGPAEDVAFGSWTLVGDVNGDGVADLAARSRNEEFAVFCRVNVWFGGPSFPAATPDAVLTGTPQAGFDFARRMAIGDVTGDGVPDLVVGAPQGSVDLIQQGAVFVVRGGPGFVSHESSDDDVLRIRGFEARLGIGRSIAIGTLGRQATPYLLVGADGTLNSPDDGRVYLIPSGPGLASGYLDRETLSITGDFAGDRFGAEMLIADVDADGVNDLVVGAPGADVPLQSEFVVDAGTVFVFLGKRDFVLSYAAAADVRMSDGVRPGDARGMYLATGRFVGGAPRDLVFGAPYRDEPGLLQAGQVQIRRSCPEFPDAVQSRTGEASGDRAGRVLPGVDLNGDGRDEVVVAAPGAAGGRGTVTVAFGPGGFAGRIVVLTGAEVGDHLGGE